MLFYQVTFKVHHDNGTTNITVPFVPINDEFPERKTWDNYDIIDYTKDKLCKKENCPPHAVKFLRMTIKEV